MVLLMRLTMATFFVMLLSIMHVSPGLSLLRPSWVLLLILYVQFFLPRYFHLTWVILLGLCLDVLSSAVIGEHALGLLLATWFASRLTRQFHFFSIAQQMILVLFFCLSNQIALAMVDIFIGCNHISVMYAIVTAVVGMLCWPWIRFVADHVFFR